MDGTIGTIMLFAANWAPRNWALCNGQLLQIAQYQALFSIIGTYYGGDGRTTFGLPDLRGRVPLGVGGGPGLNNYAMGQSGGREQNQLGQAHLPAVNLAIPASESEASVSDPNGAYPAVGNFYAAEATPGAKLGAGIPLGGSGAPLDNHPPYLTVNYVICLNGTYPSRS